MCVFVRGVGASVVGGCRVRLVCFVCLFFFLFVFFVVFFCCWLVGWLVGCWLVGWLLVGGSVVVVVVVVVAEVHIAAVDTAHSSFVEVVGFGTAEFGFAELDWRVLELM